MSLSDYDTVMAKRHLLGVPDYSVMLVTVIKERKKGYELHVACCKRYGVYCVIYDAWSVLHIT